MSNRSVLATEELCRSCGNCCKSFRLWLADDLASRLALLRDFPAAGPAGRRGGMALVELQCACVHYDDAAGKCGIFGQPDRPDLCAEFPDNLFNREDGGELQLKDDHARAMIELYRDYCPAVARLG